MKFAVFLLALIFCLQQINCEIRDNGCQNWNDILHDQEMVEVTELELYRFKKNGGNYSIFLGNEPLTVWLEYNSFAEDGLNIIAIKDKAHGHPEGKNPNVTYQINGNSSCQLIEETTQNENPSDKPFRIGRKLPGCLSCPLYQDKYIPLTMWSDGGPVEVLELVLCETPFKYYLPENQMEVFTAAGACEQTNWLNIIFSTSDYSHLKSEPNEVFKNENGKSFVRLRNDSDTVVWIEIGDLSSETMKNLTVKLELENNQTITKDVRIGLEANGEEPVSFDPEKEFIQIQNGLEIYLKTELCTGNYNFLGHIRYIFSQIDNPINMKATFYDANGVNLKLKYLDEEKYRFPIPYPEPYNFAFFTIPSTAVSTTTSSSTSTSTSTSTLTTRISTVSSSTTATSDNSNGNNSGFYDNEQSSSSFTSLSSMSTSTTSSTNIPIVSSPEALKTEESDDDGMSLGMLIGIIVGGLIGLLLLICIIVICGLRCYRSHQRKKQSTNFETETQAEEAIRKQRSIWGNLIIFLIGPSPKPSKKHRIPNHPSISLPSSQLRPTPIPTPISIPQSPVPPKPTESKTSNVSRRSTPAPTPATTPGSTPAPTPAAELPLQATQSVHSSCSDIFNETLRAAKHAKRDPRFKDLIPGTIEFMVAKGFADARSDTDDDYTRSGPRDGPEVAQFVNPH